MIAFTVVPSTIFDSTHVVRVQHETIDYNQLSLAVLHNDSILPLSLSLSLSLVSSIYLFRFLVCFHQLEAEKEWVDNFKFLIFFWLQEINNNKNNNNRKQNIS